MRILDRECVTVCPNATTPAAPANAMLHTIAHSRTRHARPSQTCTVSGMSSLADFAAGRNLRRPPSMERLGYSQEQVRRLADLPRAGYAPPESPTTLLLFTGLQGVRSTPCSIDELRKLYTIEEPPEFIVEDCYSTPVERTAVGSGVLVTALHGVLADGVVDPASARCQEASTSVRAELSHGDTVASTVAFVDPAPTDVAILDVLRTLHDRDPAIITVDPRGDAALCANAGSKPARLHMKQVRHRREISLTRVDGLGCRSQCA